ncbi:hypothetical protein LTS08_002878 [Lithohypha guttulata]|nr:hypothetical protein LTS08_002878 [Lithohypha guttulata]
MSAYTKAMSSRPSTPQVSGSGTPRTPPTSIQISHPAHKLLTRAHPSSPETATKIFTDKILNKPLLLSASTEHADERALRRHIRDRKKAYARNHARPKPLSAREKRELKLYELRPENCRYEVYVGLNQLWTRYILEVLGYLDRDGAVVKGRVGIAAVANGAGSLMASADYHGMVIEVVRSKDVGRVGVKGIVVRETRSTFTVVMDEREDRQRQKPGAPNEAADGPNMQKDKDVRPRDKVRMILKKGSVFRVVIELPSEQPGPTQTPDTAEKSAELTGPTENAKSRRQLVFELHGDQLEVRPIERAVKKFKWKPMDYL